MWRERVDLNLRELWNRLYIRLEHSHELRIATLHGPVHDRAHHEDLLRALLNINQVIHLRVSLLIVSSK